MIASLFIMMSALGAAYSQTNVNYLESYAQNITNRMRPHLPLKSGGSFTLFAVNQSNGVLVYDHTFDVVFPPENTSMVIDVLIGQSYKSACSVPDLASFTKSGGALYFRFFYNNSVLTSIKIERC